MKPSGMMRRVDALGRFVIPKEIRKQLDIQPDDCLMIALDEQNRIVIEKPQSTCAICNAQNNLINFNNKKLCKSCIDLIKSYL